MPFTLTILLCVAMGCGTYLAGRRMSPKATPEATKGNHLYLITYEMSLPGQTCHGHCTLGFSCPLSQACVQQAEESIKSIVTKEFPQYADTKVVILNVFKLTP